MAKTVRKKPADVVNELAKLWKLFHGLHFNEQQDFVDGLPPGQVLKHPFIRRLDIHDEVLTAELRDEVERQKSKIPRNPGNPTKKSVQINLAMLGFADSEIAEHEDFLAVNGGQPGEPKTIWQNLNRWGIRR